MMPDNSRFGYFTHCITASPSWLLPQTMCCLTPAAFQLILMAELLRKWSVHQTNKQRNPGWRSRGAHSHANHHWFPFCASVWRSMDCKTYRWMIYFHQPTRLFCQGRMLYSVSLQLVKLKHVLRVLFFLFSQINPGWSRSTKSSWSRFTPQRSPSFWRRPNTTQTSQQ